MNVLREMHRINKLRIFVRSLYVTHFESSVADLFITCSTFLSAKMNIIKAIEIREKQLF